MNPFQNRPDIFEMVIDKGDLDVFDVRKMDYPFGTSEEEYCFYQDVLIGLIAGNAVSSRVYYECHGVEILDRVVVNLLPNISANRNLNIPTASDFISSIFAILNLNKSVDLICEADCGRSDIMSVAIKTHELDTVLNELLGFLRGGSVGCPTFIVRKI